MLELLETPLLSGFFNKLVVCLADTNTLFSTFISPFHIFLVTLHGKSAQRHSVQADRGQKMRKWFVMKHLDMKRFKEWLEVRNIERLDNGMAMIEPFYPYDFLKDHRATGKDDETPQDFHDILFLKGTEEDVKELVDDEWNKSFRVQLHYLPNTMTGLPATVSEAAMNEFFDNCMKYRGRFELCMPINNVGSADREEGTIRRPRGIGGERAPQQGRAEPGAGRRAGVGGHLG